jgi:multisubunit Na+/H+ antiporter MnhC subunit
MYVSYKWGQKVYPIPYATKKLIAYFIITLMLYGIYLLVEHFTINKSIRLSIASIELIAFIAFVARIEKRELKSLLQKKQPATV